MVTYFLGKSETQAYLRDFLLRLARFNPAPTLWCPVTGSGAQILKEFTDMIRQEKLPFSDGISVLNISLGEGEKIEFVGGNPEADIPGKRVLIFDGAIHSGGTMQRCVDEVAKYGAADVLTYSLVVKRGSSFIPTLWGVMIGEKDRAFFLLNRIPNNRLYAGSDEKPESKRSFVYLRKLGATCLTMPLLRCNVASLDRITWEDRYFDMTTTEQDRCSYMLITGANQAAGYLTIHRGSGNRLIVDEVVVDKQHQGNNFGAILIRFAETLARHFNCEAIRLYAIQEKIGFYARFGYSQVPGR